MSIGKHTGYHHSRRITRMSQSSSIRNTAKADAALGLAALIGVALPIILLVMIFNLG